MRVLNDTALEPRDCLTLWRCLPEGGEDTSPTRESLDPERCLPNIIKKSDVVKWEEMLKQKVGKLMSTSRQQFLAIQRELHPRRRPPSASSASKDENGDDQNPSSVPDSPHLALVLDLRSSGALPAIIFDFDRLRCERLVMHLFAKLTLAEDQYKEGPEWTKKIREFEQWKRETQKEQAKSGNQLPKHQADDGEGMSKLEMLRDKASEEASHWHSFDPDVPIAKFSLADETKISREELEEILMSVKDLPIRPELKEALRRGLGVHHSGMNRQYRQV